MVLGLALEKTPKESCLGETGRCARAKDLMAPRCGQHQRPHTWTASVSGGHSGSCLMEVEAHSLAHY